MSSVRTNLTLFLLLVLNRRFAKMGRRYYCDYCDKVFIDDIEARKKHLNGAHHVRLRKLHYENFKDLRTILQIETAKEPCRKFLSNGFCQFDMTCKYTHYTEEQLWGMKQEVIRQDQQKFQEENRHPDLPSVESWLDKYNDRKNSENRESVSTFWSYPEHLEVRQDLPPSLRKFNLQHFNDSDFEDWG